MANTLLDNDTLRTSLLKKALGYDVEECSEEYQLDDDVLKLVKRKVSVKHIPPDHLAFKTYIEYFDKAEDDISKLSDEELDDKINELIKLLKGD